MPRLASTKAAGVAQHVRVDLKGHLGLNAGALDQLGQAGDREWRAALTHEDEGRLGLALEHAQRPQFVTEQWMRGSCPALGSAQVKGAGLKLHVGPLKLAQLRGPQAVPEGDQDRWRCLVAP